MSHTLTPQNEAEDACDEVLQSRFCVFRNILLQAESERAMALTRLQTLQTELNIKRALKPGFSRPGC